MRELIKVYEESLRKLQERHVKLLSEIHVYDKRVALLEEEMDELCEAMSMMRRHLEG
jgi:chromosome segregation ATPase